MKTLVLDAGHGGRDSGAVYDGGRITEKQLNLLMVNEILKALHPYMRAKKLRVYLTRSNDRFVSLGNRVKMCKINKADLFVSIHFNSFRLKSAHGFELFSNSITLASIFHKSLSGFLKRYNVTDRGVKSQHIYVVTHNPTKAVLLEPCFPTNPKELVLVKNPAFRNRLGNEIAYCSVKYLGLV